ncbi:RcnB family protein [Sphingomonas donggukensis]|uniref:17 kDa surface antigen n=1 Tax=Sphingomonas donggukensis TaxID=2949093 RepID=A0ABY4TUN6_9SPHN|nr:RcnB family protein [Sphingomonas donggukensis]URW76118.1 RcnB family protein [Sphingomonas donggukensis]
MRNLLTAATIAGCALAAAPAADAQAIAQARSAGGTVVTQAPAGGAAFAQSSAPIVRTTAPAGSWTATTAQRRGGMWQGRPTMPRTGNPGMRWGQSIGGRWHGGVRAPGGWAAYRRPARGWVLPGYWFAPSFYVNDYAAYGLGAPPYGYTWTRYYDDAVLVDGRGRVYDSVTGLDWDRYAYDDRAYDDGDRYYADGADDHYGPRPRGDRGMGGAVIGGVVGGVAGNVIAGRGNRLPGTIVGAGVGAVVGSAIDRAEDRDDRRGARRPLPPIAPDHAPPPSPGYGYGSMPYGHGYSRTWVAGGSSYAAGSTIVHVQPTVTTTTTTTTEYVYETAARASYKKRSYRKPVVRSKILSRDCRCNYTK